MLFIITLHKNITLIKVAYFSKATAYYRFRL